MRLRALVLIVTLIGSTLMTARPVVANHNADTTLTVTSPSRGKITGPIGTGDGIDCGLGQTNCSETYPVEESCFENEHGAEFCSYFHPEVDLTATAQTDWAFSAWTGACSAETGTTCQLDMGSDRAVGAMFTDPSPPSVTMITPAAGWHSGDVTLAANAGDAQSAISRVDFHVLPPPPAVCCWTELSSDFSFPYSFLWNSNFPFTTSGTYRLRARATNGGGLQTLSSETEVDIDNNDPTVVWENPPQAAPTPLTINPNGLPLQVETADATSSVTGVQFLYSTTGPDDITELLGDATDNSGYWEYMWTDLSLLSDGDHIWIKAVASDEAGNTGASSVFEFVIDAVPAALQFTQGPAAGAVRRFTSESFTFSTSELLSFTQCTATRQTGVPIQKVETCEAGTPFEFDGLTDGPWKVQVMAQDVASNDTILERTWTVDTIKPNTRLTSGPKRRTKARKATFRFRSTETGSKFQCKLDRQRYKSCSSPKTVRRLKKGRHTMKIRAIDRAGNVDGTPVVKRWRVV
jgi:hypothetical protein